MLAVWEWLSSVLTVRSERLNDGAKPEMIAHTVLCVGLRFGMHVACLDTGSPDEHRLALDGIYG